MYLNSNLKIYTLNLKMIYLNSDLRTHKGNIIQKYILDSIWIVCLLAIYKTNLKSGNFCKSR